MTSLLQNKEKLKEKKIDSPITVLDMVSKYILWKQDKE